MSHDVSENAAPETQLALAHTEPSVRAALRIFLEFDMRLSRLVSGSSEPMLGQMRLAWWRDALGKDVSDRPAGDPVLDAIAMHWTGAEAALIDLVDGWEHMLIEPPLPRAAAAAFVNGRAGGLSGLCKLARADDATRAKVRGAATVWAIADAASHVAREDERETLLQLGREQPRPERLNAPFRGIAILGALGWRSIKAGGAPLMEGRGAALVALRAGLSGR